VEVEAVVEDVDRVGGVVVVVLVGWVGCVAEVDDGGAWTVV
jgi:hypothetical protein